MSLFVRRHISAGAHRGARAAARDASPSTRARRTRRCSATARSHAAVRASCSLPGVFAPSILGGHRYLDGAVRHNVPASVCIDAGADFVIACDVVPLPGVPRGKHRRGLTGLRPRHDAGQPPVATPSARCTGSRATAASARRPSPTRSSRPTSPSTSRGTSRARGRSSRTPRTSSTTGCARPSRATARSPGGMGSYDLSRCRRSRSGSAGFASRPRASRSCATPRRSLIVAYHGGPWTFDLWLLGDRMHDELGYFPRAVWHRLWWALPGLSVGGARARRPARRADASEMDELKARGEHLIVAPGGMREAMRPFWDDGRVDLGDRRGYLRLALRHDLPIIPVVATGPRRDVRRPQRRLQDVAAHLRPRRPAGVARVRHGRDLAARAAVPGEDPPAHRRADPARFGR